MWRTVTVKVNEQQFTAQIKQYETGSNYGIGGGRISKLLLKDENGDTVANYDRGWDICPETIEQEAALETILRAWN